MSQPELRFGRVSEVDASKARVRVAFADRDDVVSWWLPVLQGAAGGADAAAAYLLPGKGQLVACLFVQAAELGVVLGAIYSDQDAPPAASDDVVRLAFGDGTSIEYDRASHHLAVAVADGGSVEISAKSVTINVPADGEVLLGGAGGEELVRWSWVENVFATHVHPHPQGATGTPSAGAGAKAAPNVTTRTKAL